MRFFIDNKVKIGWCTICQTSVEDSRVILSESVNVLLFFAGFQGLIVYETCWDLVQWCRQPRTAWVSSPIALQGACNSGWLALATAGWRGEGTESWLPACHPKTTCKPTLEHSSHRPALRVCVNTPCGAMGTFHSVDGCMCANSQGRLKVVTWEVS